MVAPALINIVGLDPARMPRIQTMPAIDLFFELNEEPPKLWIEEFLNLARTQPYPVKMDKDSQMFVVSWVRKTEEIESFVRNLVQVVRKSNEAYAERVRKDAAALGQVQGAVETISPEQKRLNEVLAGLKFA